MMVIKLRRIGYRKSKENKSNLTQYNQQRSTINIKYIIIYVFD